MANASQIRAESQFAIVGKAKKRNLSEQELADQAVTENTARLKALRLAKESADRANPPEKKKPAKRKAGPRK